MDKKLETRNYIRKQDAKSYLGLGIISWILICIWIIFHPNWSFENNRDFLELKGDTIPSYSITNKGEGFKLYESNKVYSFQSKLRPVAGYLFDKNKIIVDDENGNRLAISVKNLNSYPKDLRILNHQFRYVYNRKDLNGKQLKDIINESGEYTFLDKEKRIATFPQIVLFNGSDRVKGVVLTYDENNKITQTGIWDSPHSNLYTHIPYYDRIASWNLFIKFQRFTTSNEYENSFLTETLIWIFWYAFDCLVCIAMILIALGIIFFSVYPLLFKLSKIPNIPNIVIYLLTCLLIPFMILVSLSLLFFYNHIWWWTAITEITYLTYTVILILNLTPAYVRCSKCHKMNCIDVTETDYLYDRQIISAVGNSFIENTYEPQQKAQEKWYIRTEYYEKCKCCGNVNEYNRKSIKAQEMRNINEINCPKCGQYTLEVGSLLIKNDIKTYKWSSTKKGDIKEVSKIFGESDYIKRDITTYYTQSSGDLTYKLCCKCKNCDYQYSELYKKYYDSGKTNNGSEEKTTYYKKV